MQWVITSPLQRGRSKEKMLAEPAFKPRSDSKQQQCLSPPYNLSNIQNDTKFSLSSTMLLLGSVPVEVRKSVAGLAKADAGGAAAVCFESHWEIKHKRQVSSVPGSRQE
jgi:hypothetical protein